MLLQLHFLYVFKVYPDNVAAFEKLRLWSLSYKSRRKTVNSSENKTLDNVCTCVFPGCALAVRLITEYESEAVWWQPTITPHHFDKGLSSK